ncbi:hypothetical protein G4G93_35050 [Methylobacterium sp. DB0501]|uniref:hypothetical protein n=1 Tax=Methylobacterium sp. DB0501 TaxID=2709665 RepID=UPI0013EA6051|nr:hypothetical protein [Methylobacterium sp. DB0501]NGM39037.1 hypothetical protein [Methylobacterium sp. DB0501]
MDKFFVSKTVAPGDLPALVIALNAKTRDGYIVRQVQITPLVWLVLVGCSWRDDAEFVRGL